jgi:hypothetical protein
MKESTRIDNIIRGIMTGVYHFMGSGEWVINDTESGCLGCSEQDGMLYVDMATSEEMDQGIEKLQFFKLVPCDPPDWAEAGMHLPGKETFRRMLDFYPKLRNYAYFKEYEILVDELSARRAKTVNKNREKFNLTKLKVTFDEIYQPGGPLASVVLSEMPVVPKAPEEKPEQVVTIRLEFFQWMLTRLLEGVELASIEELRKQGVSDRTILDLVLHVFNLNTPA